MRSSLVLARWRRGEVWPAPSPKKAASAVWERVGVDCDERWRWTEGDETEVRAWDLRRVVRDVVTGSF